MNRNILAFSEEEFRWVRYKRKDGEEFKREGVCRLCMLRKKDREREVYKRPRRYAKKTLYVIN